MDLYQAEGRFFFEVSCNRIGDGQYGGPDGITWGIAPNNGFSYVDDSLKQLAVTIEIYPE